MPELPEVETILRVIEPRLVGQRLVEAQFFSKRVVRGRADRVAARIEGRKIVAVRRHGKFLVLELEGGEVLTVQLGMTGKLLWDGTPGPYTRALFLMTNGRLVFDDVRQFGRIEMGEARLKRLGPDALSVSLEELLQRLQSHRGAIKPLLLNQTFLRGLGNIYTDEALFRAGIHPRAAAARLSRTRVQRLHRAILDVLKAAIKSGGLSVSDYVDAEGGQGRYQFQHQVYGKGGEPCRRLLEADPPHRGRPARDTLLSEVPEAVRRTR